MWTFELILLACAIIACAFILGSQLGYQFGRRKQVGQTCRVIAQSMEYRIAYLTLALDHLPPHLTAQECIDGIEEAHQIITRMDGLSE